VKRDREWLNRFWPQFYFHLEPTNYFTLGAKQTGNNSSITFLLSRDKNIYEENSPEYLGKVKANFTGTLVNVFGRGYNPKDYIEKNLPLR
jgi:tubby-related protein 1